MTAFDRSILRRSLSLHVFVRFYLFIYYSLEFCPCVKAWNEQQRVFASKRRPECINLLQKNHRRTKLPNTVTVDSIYEKKFLSLSSVLEAVVVDAFVLPGSVSLLFWFHYNFALYH